MKKRKKSEYTDYLTAQKIVKNYREKQKSFQYNKKQVSLNKKVNNKFFDKTRINSPVLIIRICGIWERITESTKDILTKLKLKKVNSSTIIRYTKENFDLLNIIDSYVTWGYVNKKTVSNLVIKRGSIYSGSDKTIKELDNATIENNLGKKNILCIEDLIHELCALTAKNFEAAMNFLGFFLLSPCEDLEENMVLPFYKGGNTGFRGNEINKLASRMV